MVYIQSIHRAAHQHRQALAQIPTWKALADRQKAVLPLRDAASGLNAQTSKQINGKQPFVCMPSLVELPMLHQTITVTVR